MADTSIDSLNNNLFFLSAAFARKLTREADEAFASMGLSSSHALLLLLIQQEPEIQPGQLAEKLYLKPSTITRLVQKLERQALVRKESSGRAAFIVCTDKGLKIANKIAVTWRELNNVKRDELGSRYAEVLSEMVSNALDELEK